MRIAALHLLPRMVIFFHLLGNETPGGGKMLEVDMEIIFKRPRGYSVPSGCGKGSGVLVADRTFEIIG